MFKVIVLDDEDIIREGIRSRITNNNLELEITGEYSNGQEALDFIEKNEVDAAIVDIRMPVMDGLTFTCEAKKRKPELRIRLHC